MELGARWGTWGARAVAMLKVARPGIPHEAGQKTSCQILTSNVIRWSSVISSDILGLTSFVFCRSDLFSSRPSMAVPDGNNALNDSAACFGTRGRMAPKWGSGSTVQRGSVLCAKATKCGLHNVQTSKLSHSGHVVRNLG